MDEKTAAPPARIRALARGLAVLELLNEKPLATVSQIVAATGFPKASVIRILATLRLEGFIDLNDGGAGFRVLPKARLLSSALAIQDPAVGAIEHLLGDFSQA
ncbi:MAG TPA: helix-turn-helix domain-containing protein, partial [Hyphomicrobiales bacterium]|nr:helix-turn-helix domain-containing protein [Hyphomicrobiales bacterium]